MPPIDVGELFGYYVIFIDKSDAVLYALGYALLGLFVMWVANRPQPVPHWSKDEKVVPPPRHRPRHRR